MKFGIPNALQCPDIGQNLDGDISDFQISGRIPYKKNVITPEPVMIDIKLGPVTKLAKRNKIMSDKFDDNVLSRNYDVIVIFLIYGLFGAIRNPDAAGMVYDFYIFLITAFYFTKSENRTNKSPTQLSHYCFE